MLGGALNGRLNVTGVPAPRLLATGLILTTTTALLLLLLSLTGLATLATVTPLVFVTTIASSLITPNATVGALHPVPEAAGLASSIIVCVQWLVGALAGALAGLLFDGRTPRGLAEVMSGFALAALIVFWTIVFPIERHSREVGNLSEGVVAETVDGT